MPRPVDPNGERFRLVFEGSALGIAVLSSSGHVLHANPALRSLFGYSELELEGLTIGALTHPDDVAAERAVFDRVLAGEPGRHQLDGRYIHKSGDVVTARLTASRVPAGCGADQIIVMVEDVTGTARARVEEARLVSELGERVKELTALHETARMMQNEKLPPGELLARVAKLLPPAFRFPDIAAARVSYGEIDVRSPNWANGPWRMSTAFRTRDGRSGEVAVTYLEDRTLEGEGNPFLLEERKLIESIADMLEVALERRHAHERLSIAVASTNIGVWEWDLATNRLVWSDEMERIAGLPPGTFAGTYAAFIALVHRDDLAHLQVAVRRALDEGSSGDLFVVEYRMVMPDHTPRWMQARGKVQRDGAGRPMRMVGTCADVSDRRRLEEELRHSQKMEAIGRLAGGVAHDFNNLLTVIAANCDFLLYAASKARKASRAAGEEPADDALERLSEIRDAAERASALTRQLMSFSRKNQLQPHSVDPALFLHNLGPILRRLVGDSVRLDIEVEDDVGFTRVDVGHLEQVLVNVVVNARDAMPTGGALTIRVYNAELTAADLAAHPGVQPGAYIAFSVSDTGQGMSFETLARIFEPFFTTKDPRHGTGLGLSTVFGIVRQSGGHITAHSQLGVGSTFVVYMPSVDAEWVHDSTPPSHLDEDEERAALVRRPS